MEVDYRDRAKRAAVIVLSILVLLMMYPWTMMSFAETGLAGKSLDSSNVTVTKFAVMDENKGNQPVEHKISGKDSDYGNYLGNPSNFSSVVCGDQSNSALSVALDISYTGNETINEGDTLTIPAYIGELDRASFAAKTLNDAKGNNLGTYEYRDGAFILHFSGEYIRSKEVKSFKGQLYTGTSFVSNDSLGEGKNGERAILSGKLLANDVIVGFEKKNVRGSTEENRLSANKLDDKTVYRSANTLRASSLERASNTGLSLDHVKIKEFKIIDKDNLKTEIDYKKKGESGYEDFKNDPSKFKNAICQEQKKTTDIVLFLNIDYVNAGHYIKEGDVLTIPASYGGKVESFAEKDLMYGNHKLGTWVYKGGNFVLKFNGDYIRNNKVDHFNASFETGHMTNYIISQPKTLNKGERVSKEGKIGREDIVVPFEKNYVKAKKDINKTINSISKGAISTTDTQIIWTLNLRSDYFLDEKNTVAYFNPYMLEHNGAYSPNALTGIYMEDTFEGCSDSPEIAYMATMMGALSDKGVVSGFYILPIPMSILKKVDQGTKTAAEVRNGLKDGEYCIYNNKNGTYTLMIKWWDMNNGKNGPTYDDLPEIKSAGGVGNYLKKENPDIYKDISEETVKKTNELYRGKSLQNVDIRVKGFYDQAKAGSYEGGKNPNVKKNVLKYKSDQTGEKETTEVNATLTPPKGEAGTTPTPLSITLKKVDLNTGKALSDGFKFRVVKSVDKGNTWDNVGLKGDRVEKGTLNEDRTVTPDENGVIKVTNLAGDKLYRFEEVKNPEAYEDVRVNNEEPNDKEHPLSANSKEVYLTTQNADTTVHMYNKKKPVEVVIEGDKKLIGRKLADKEFKFALFDKNNKLIKEAVNDEKGKFKVSLAFEEEGKYEYLFKEINDGKEGMTYDDSSKPVVVEVTSDENGRLKAEIKSAPVEFVNKFTPPAIPPNPGTPPPVIPPNPGTPPPVTPPNDGTPPPNSSIPPIPPKTSTPPPSYSVPPAVPNTGDENCADYMLLIAVSSMMCLYAFKRKHI